jgi:hypothetical protein
MEFIDAIDIGMVVDLLEICFGFAIGIAARIRFLKPKDLTIMLQVAILGVRILKLILKKYHPIKRERNYSGVDQDLTAMHEKILREHNLPAEPEIT